MVTVKHQDDYDDVKPKEKVHVVKRPTKKVRDRSRGASSRLNNFRVHAASDWMEFQFYYHDDLLSMTIVILFPSHLSCFSLCVILLSIHLFIYHTIQEAQG
jgi:hypothetical protein